LIEGVLVSKKDGKGWKKIQGRLKVDNKNTKIIQWVESDLQGRSKVSNG
jgi:hypothetical protein